jgi:predicted nucleotidyltransferase component of viral defense system
MRTESTARNIRVQNRYDELMKIGKHGHYETMFRVVREEVELAKASRDAEVAELKKELYAVSVALDDPRTDLTMTMVEVIADQHKERDQLRNDVKALREALDQIADDDYDGSPIPIAKQALAATEH